MVTRGIASRTTKRLLEVGYWREREGRAALAAWRRSGLTLAAFGRESGIAATRLRWWKARIGEPPPASDSPTVLPVDLVSGNQLWAARVTEADAIAIETAGRVVRVSRGFDGDTLLAVIELLEARPRC